MTRKKRKNSRSRRSGRKRHFRISGRTVKKFAIGFAVYAAAILVLALSYSPVREFLRAGTPVRPVTRQAVPETKITTPAKKAPVKSKATPDEKPQATAKAKTAKPLKTQVIAEKPRKKEPAAVKAEKSVTAAPSTSKTAPQGPILVFVIDDVGYTLADQDLLTRLGGSVTYAIMPALPHSKYFASLSRRTGAEVILHLPMEPMNGPFTEEGRITTGMPREDVLDILHMDMEDVPNMVGVNNHKGSLATSNTQLMTAVLSDLKKNDMFFFDSYTCAGSVSSEVCRKLGMPVLRRDIFLDNSNESAYIRTQVARLLRVAQKRGYAIAIGHYRPNTLKVLSEEIPRLKKEGARIMSLSQLIRVKGVK